MDLNTVFSDYWEILNLTEDYIKGGYRSDHEPAPAFRFEVPREEPAAAPAPAEPPASGSPEERIASCRQCDLHLARKQAILGTGPAKARLMIVLPPPGYEEDEQNTPITGEGAAFLDKWITAVGLTRDAVFLTNCVKCRTPGTRPPFAGEVETCSSFLREQIAERQPEAVLLLGDTALSSVDRSASLNEKRGKPFFVDNVFYLASYDPLQVLRDLNLKRPLWEDLKILRDFLNHG